MTTFFRLHNFGPDSGGFPALSRGLRGGAAPVAEVDGEMNPSDLLYSEAHQWVRVVDKKATIGITEFKVSQMGEPVYVELPDKGEKIELDEIYGEIGSNDMAEDLICPVAGKVTGVNMQLTDDPSVIALDPYEEGWLIELKIADTDALEALMTGAEYEEYISAFEEEEEETEDEDFGFAGDVEE